MTDTDRTCLFDGCGAPVKALSLCGGHYAQNRRGADLTPLNNRSALNSLSWPTPSNDGVCVGAGCSRPAHARGLCNGHYEQVRNSRPIGSLRQHNRTTDGKKVCGQCLATKPIIEFGKQLHRVQWMCLQCRRIDSRVRAYGISWGEAVALKSVTECHSCGSTIDAQARNHHIDHCHETGAVRGVLCHGCNTSLGLLGEDPMRIRALADYAERARAADAA